VLASLLIVFREVIEAGLIVGIVLAATNGVARRELWIAAGVGVGVVGACLVAVFAEQLGAMFEGSGQELFNAAILAFAVLMLTWHNVWMAGHGKQMAREMREIGALVSAGQRTLAALAVVVGVAVLREGSEVVLFLYGIAAQGGTSKVAMLAGGGLGLCAGAIVSALLYFGLLAIPAHRLFSVTSWLITLLAAGMASQAVLFLQQGGYFEILTSTVWDTSWLLSEGSIAGRLLHTLIGYSDAPNGAQLIVYVATILTISLLMRMVPGKRTLPDAIRTKAPKQLKRRIDGIEQCAIARVLPTRSHVVRGIAECDARLRVTEAERAARAEMAERARIGSQWPFRLRQLKSDPEAARSQIDNVGPVHLLGSGGRDSIGAQDLHPVDRSAIGESRVDAGDAPGVGVTVGGGHFGFAPRSGIDPVRAGKAGRIPIGVPAHQSVIAFDFRFGGVSRPGEFRHATMLRCGKADVNVGAEWPGHILAQQRSDRSSADPPNQLARQKAERVDVVAVRRSRFPPRCLCRECGGHHLPVERGTVGQRLADRGQSCLVRHELAHRDGFFSGGCKFRPVLRHAPVEIERAGIHQPHDRDGAEGLADRKDVYDRVARPRYLARQVRPAAPEIADDAAVVPNGKRGAAFASLGEIQGKLLAQFAKPLVAETRDKRRIFVGQSRFLVRQRLPYPQDYVSRQIGRNRAIDFPVW